MKKFGLATLGIVAAIVVLANLGSTIGTCHFRSNRFCRVPLLQEDVIRHS